MKTDLRNLQMCALCEQREATSDEHVPAQALFPKPRPSNLITVPACDICNGGTSQDDEYLRLMIQSRREIEDNPAIIALQPTISRAFARPENQKFRMHLMKNTRFIVEASTIVRAQHYFDLDRLARATAKIIRGLYFKETASILPQTCSVRTYADIGFSEAGQDSLNKLLAVLRREGKLRTIHPDIFSYIYLPLTLPMHKSLWLLRFYREVWFFGVTGDLHETDN